MRLVVDYLVRNKLLKDFVVFPCSIFVSCKNLDRSIITIDKRDDFFILKYWNISSCSCHQALPSFSETTTKNIFDSSHFTNYQMFSFHDKGLSYDSNLDIQPIIEQVYFYFFDNFINYEGHNKEKEKYLWEEFLKIHFLDLYFVVSHIFYWQNWSIKQQMIFIKENYKKKWKYWLQWRKHLLFFGKIPTELVFSQLGDF